MTYGHMIIIIGIHGVDPTPVEEVSWLSPIVVVPKKIASSGFVWIFENSMPPPRRIHILYLLLKRMLDEMARHEIYSFLDEFSIIIRS